VEAKEETAGESENKAKGKLSGSDLLERYLKKK